MENLTNFKKKICLLGAFGWVKTSLIQRFVYERFDEKYLTTLGVNISQKIMPPIRPGNGQGLIQYTFLIWDIAGVEKFTPMNKTYYSGASAGIAVADLSRPDTMNQLEGILAKFSEAAPEAPVIILGNKLDLVEFTAEVKDQLKTVANNLNHEHIFTSAKTGYGVENAFIKIAQKLADSDG